MAYDPSRYSDMLKDEEMFVFGLRVVQYFDSEGNLCFRLHHDGKIHVTQVVGLLDMAKYEVLKIGSELGRATNDE